MPKTLAKTVKIIHIGLRKKEAWIVDKMEEEGDSVPEMIRILIRNYGEEKYPSDPGYVDVKKQEIQLKKQKLKEKELSNEEYAEKKLRAIIKDGYAWISGTGSNQPVPLTEIKYFDINGDAVKYHFSILDDKEFSVMGNIVGPEWRKEARERFFALNLTKQ
jgi:hypothetical protein